MFPDAKWLDALSLPARVFGGLTAFFAVSLMIDGWLQPLLPSPWWAFFVLGALLFGCLFSASMVALGLSFYQARARRMRASERRQAAKDEKAIQRQEWRTNTLKRLDHLSPAELRYFAQALRENSQSFTGYVRNAALSNLMGKELLNSPGGVHHQDHFPFWIPDFVWAELLRRRAEFIARDDEFLRVEREAARAGQRR